MIKKKKDNYAKIILLLVGDILSVLAGFYLAFVMRIGGDSSQLFSLYVKSFFIITLLLIVSFMERRLYTKKYLYYLDEILDIFISFIIVLLVFMLFLFIYKVGPKYSRFVIGMGFLFSFILDVIVRYVIRLIFAKTELFKTRVLIIGGGKTGEFLIKTFKSTGMFYNIVGILDDNKTGSIEGINIIGKLSDLSKVLSNNKIDEVIFAITVYPVEKMLNTARICDSSGVNFKVVPNIFGLATASASLEEIEGIILLNLKRNKIVGFNAFVKRTIDIIVSLIALVVLAIPMFIIAILIKLDSKGPVFFKHKRIGQFGKTFYCLKFRTMVNDAEKKLQELFEKEPALREEFYKNFKLKNDPRITKVGKFLRKYSLDEVPQVFNVLKGDMSIIGPRPVVEKEIEKYGKYIDLILEAKPGMAGLWVAKGRNDIDYEERVLLDVYYLQNWSLWLDIKIFVYAALSVVKGKGAY